MIPAPRVWDSVFSFDLGLNIVIRLFVGPLLLGKLVWVAACLSYVWVNGYCGLIVGLCRGFIALLAICVLLLCYYALNSFIWACRVFS